MQRLQKHAEFVEVLRRHTKVAAQDFVVHYSLDESHETSPESAAEPIRRLGLAVNKRVGNAVARNRAKRRIRALARQQEDLLPYGVDLVVRALPSFNQAAFASLDAQMSRAFLKVSQRARGQERQHG